MNWEVIEGNKMQLKSHVKRQESKHEAKEDIVPITGSNERIGIALMLRLRERYTMKPHAPRETIARHHPSWRTDMNRSRSPYRTRTLVPACLLALVFTGLVASPRPAAAQSKEKDEIAHAFFTHEGLPDAVGSYSLRTSGLATRIDGETKGDFAYHLETGLTDSIGLHVRTDQFLQSRRSEVMFQFVAWKSKDGESGFAPIIEF